jgi:hypothetical protein
LLICGHNYPAVAAFHPPNRQAEHAKWRVARTSLPAATSPASTNSADRFRCATDFCYRDRIGFNVYCFADRAQAEQFHARFGGEFIDPISSPKWPSSRRR